MQPLLPLNLELSTSQTHITWWESFHSQLEWDVAGLQTDAGTRGLQFQGQVSISFAAMSHEEDSLGQEVLETQLLE